jgi:hypothetical protein
VAFAELGEVEAEADDVAVFDEAAAVVADTDFVSEAVMGGGLDVGDTCMVLPLPEGLAAALPGELAAALPEGLAKALPEGLGDATRECDVEGDPV